MLFDKALIDRFYNQLSDSEKQEFMFRRSGRSTSLALRYLSEAIANPRREIRVYDHHPTPAADRFLLDTVLDITKQLGLEHMEFDRQRITVCFNWEHPLQKFLKEKGKTL